MVNVHRCCCWRNRRQWGFPRGSWPPETRGGWLGAEGLCVHKAALSACPCWVLGLQMAAPASAAVRTEAQYVVLAAQGPLPSRPLFAAWKGWAVGDAMCRRSGRPLTPCSQTSPAVGCRTQRRSAWVNPVPGCKGRSCLQGKRSTSQELPLSHSVLTAAQQGTAALLGLRVAHCATVFLSQSHIQASQRPAAVPQSWLRSSAAAALLPRPGHAQAPLRQSSSVLLAASTSTILSSLCRVLPLSHVSPPPRSALFALHRAPRCCCGTERRVSQQGRAALSSGRSAPQRPPHTLRAPWCPRSGAGSRPCSPPASRSLPSRQGLLLDPHLQLGSPLVAAPFCFLFAAFSTRERTEVSRRPSVESDPPAGSQHAEFR